MYSLVRPLLFRLDAERSHTLVMELLALISRHRPALRLLRKCGQGGFPSIPAEVAGLTVPNPLGLAAGLDKDARAFPALAASGFGWIELGTVTPKPQPGNPRPRLFRIRADQALVNRMGFNSGGLETFIENLRNLRRLTDCVVGVNIGKNASTPLDKAADDYLVSMDAVYSLADYVAVNISSPNTASLRELQDAARLEHLVEQLTRRRQELADYHNRFLPLFLKIAPDLTSKEVEVIARITREYGLDAVIATNTTVTRPFSPDPVYAEPGGLSGAPLRDLSTGVVSTLYGHLGTETPIIGVGGISSHADVVDKVKAGARLLQIYTGFIFQGPIMIKRILQGLEQSMQSMQIRHWSSYTKHVVTESQ